VDPTVDILNGVVHDLMGIVAGESVIAEQEVGVERRSRFDVLADLRLEDMLYDGWEQPQCEPLRRAQGCP